MKNLSITFLFVLAFSNLVYGEFAYEPIKDRVKNSDLIIIGTLRNVSEHHTREIDYSKGTLLIENVLFGNIRTTEGLQLKSGDKFQVEWANSNMIACRFGFSENEKEIYFLQIAESGNIESLSPSSSASIEDIAEVKKYLKKKKTSNQSTKIIQSKKENQQQTEYIEETFDEVIKRSLYLEENSHTKYYPFSALLVILGSLSLYYFLYKSRFKIR